MFGKFARSPPDILIGMSLNRLMQEELVPLNVKLSHPWICSISLFMLSFIYLKAEDFSPQGSYTFFIMVIPRFNMITIISSILLYYIAASYILTYSLSLSFFFSSFWLVTNSSGLFLFLGWSHIWLPFWTPTHFNSFSVDSLQSSMPIIMPVANTYNFCLFTSNFVLLFLFVTSS